MSEGSVAGTAMTQHEQVRKPDQLLLQDHCQWMCRSSCFWEATHSCIVQLQWQCSSYASHLITPAAQLSKRAAHDKLELEHRQGLHATMDSCL